MSIGDRTWCPKGGKNYATTARGVLDRAMAMVQCKQYKAFKRDIKPNGTMTGDSLTAYEFLRANLEYVKVSQMSSTHEFLRENLEYVKVSNFSATQVFYH